MRYGILNSFSGVVALVAVGALALAAMVTLNGCGGGTGADGTPIATLRVQGRVVNELGRGVSDIRIIVLDEQARPLGSAASDNNGVFTIALGPGVRPAKFKVDISNRSNDYFTRYIRYDESTVDIVECAVNLPPPQGNVINIGTVTVFSDATPPPIPDDTCP